MKTLIVFAVFWLFFGVVSLIVNSKEITSKIKDRGIPRWKIPILLFIYVLGILPKTIAENLIYFIDWLRSPVGRS
jgi:hypothetical protein